MRAGMGRAALHHAAAGVMRGVARISVAGVLLVLGAAALSAQAVAVEPPDAVLRAVYQLYLETAPDTVVGFDFTDPTVAAAYFDPQLTKLLVADAKSGDPRLNFDPFIEGQDFEIKAVACQTKAVTKKDAQVVCQFDNFDEKKVVSFKMVRITAGWRIADVTWDRNPQSLRALLTKPAR